MFVVVFAVGSVLVNLFAVGVYGLLTDNYSAAFASLGAALWAFLYLSAHVRGGIGP